MPPRLARLLTMTSLLPLLHGCIPMVGVALATHADDQKAAAGMPDTSDKDLVALIPEGQAKIAFRMTAIDFPMEAKYQLNTSGKPCGDFMAIGRLFRPGDENRQYGSFMEKMANKTQKLLGAYTEIEKLVPGNQMVQIQSKAFWKVLPNKMYTCLPLISTFQAEASKIYLVEMGKNERNMCSQRIMDITDPAQKKLVPSVLSAACES